MAAPYGSSFDHGGTVVTDTSMNHAAGNRILEIGSDVTLLSQTETKVFKLIEGGDRFLTSTPSWFTETLDSIDTSNAFAEGADYTYVDSNVPERIQNVTQIFRKTASVTGTTQAEAHYTRVKEMERQVQLRMKEFLRDLEYACINSDIGIDNEATAKTTRGILHSIYDASNQIDGGGSGGLTLTHYKELLQKVYEDNFYITDVFMTDARFEEVNAFVGGPSTADPALGQRNIDSKSEQITDKIMAIDTIYGLVNHHLLRSTYITDVVAGSASPDEVAFGIDREFWKWCWLNERSPFMEEPPKDGDRWRQVIMGEGGVKDAAGGAAGAFLYDLV